MTKSTQVQAGIGALIDSLCSDTITSSDQAILDDLKERSIDSISYANSTRAVIEDAIRACLKQKLIEAKKAFDAYSSHPTPINLEDARARLDKKLNTESKSYASLTLAARKGTKLSDEDAASLVADIEELEEFAKNTDDGK
jgi:hypothetical protein